ncbi:MAG: T9SS type A sorting domain-containing protein [candidate division KSB1 bacterium]|nr:T9SS type A sorting domain-containing protein [candidate division KSB1 bacterium]
MKLFLLSVICFTLAAPFAHGLDYQVSWIGNTFSGKSKWVQEDIADIFVTADGRVFTNVFWDENGGEVTEFKNGDFIRTAQNTHGWGYHGGDAITANSRYVYFGYFIENEGGGLVDPVKWPPKGYDWYAVERRFKSNIQQPALFEGGKGGKSKGSYLLIHELPNNTKGAHISGLAADDALLFVSCPYDNKIRVFDAQTMKPVGEWSVERPGKLALDGEGMLWAVSGHTIRRFSREGEALPQQIVFDPKVMPSDIAVDKQNRLFACDQDLTHQIHIFENITTTPTFSRTFGTLYGVLAGPIVGEFGDLRFNHPVGVGVDDAGNIYVACRGPLGGGGSVLESYRGDGTLNWRLMGLEFVDCAAVDPESEIDVYTKEEHFVLDYSRPAGSQWTYKGYLINKIKYPDDPRLHVWSAGAKVQRIQGRLFLFVNTMHMESLIQCYRFNRETDGETAIPSVFFAARPYTDKGSWPNGQPKLGEYIWRDADGDGAFDPDEYIQNRKLNAPEIWGWSVDSEGTVWQATRYDGIRKFPLQGFDEHGNPIWTYEKMEIIKMPQPLNRLERVYYLPKLDAMFLVGYTREHPHHDGMWKIMGREIVRYDQWSLGNRIPTWQVVPDYLQDATGNLKPASVAITEEYLFVCYVIEEFVDIFSTETGDYVGRLSHTQALGDCGWVDIPEGIEAFKRSNGEYLIFVEEDLKAKVIMYQWRPQVANVEVSLTPKEFALLPAVPNPFNPMTSITVVLAEARKVSVTVYNLLGQPVRTLLNSYRQPGRFQVFWNGTDEADQPVAGGVYLICLEAGDRRVVQKVILLK